MKPIGLNADQHRNAVVVIRALRHAVFIERHLRHRARADAAELDRGARLQAAYRIGEEQQVILMHGIQRILRAALVVEQLVLAFSFAGSPRSQPSGTSKLTPPLNSVVNEPISTRMPCADMSNATPLSFQKRTLVVTS